MKKEELIAKAIKLLNERLVEATQCSNLYTAIFNAPNPTSIEEMAHIRALISSLEGGLVIEEVIDYFDEQSQFFVDVAFESANRGRPELRFCTRDLSFRLLDITVQLKEL